MSLSACTSETNEKFSEMHILKDSKLYGKEREHESKKYNDQNVLNVLCDLLVDDFAHSVKQKIDITKLFPWNLNLIIYLLIEKIPTLKMRESLNEK